jgi:hypothetical protein
LHSPFDIARLGLRGGDVPNKQRPQAWIVSTPGRGHGAGVVAETRLQGRNLRQQRKPA